MQIQQITVFGGSGFVGRQLANVLAAEGISMIVPTRSRERARALWPLPNVIVREFNPCATASLSALLEGSQACINLVGILNERRDDGTGFHAVHVEFTRQLLAACTAQGCGHFLQLSALHASPAAPSHYLRSKGEAERMISAWAAVGESAACIIRPSVIFGTEDSFYNRFARLLRLAPGILPLACAEARFAPVWVGDVVAVIVHLLQQPARGVRTFDLCGPRVHRLLDIVRWTARQIGVRRLIVPLGPRASRLQAALLEHLPGKPLSRDNVRSTTLDSLCPDGGALPGLGIVPTPVEAIMGPWLAGTSQPARLARLRRQGGY